MERGSLIVLSAPSGTGKSTVLKALMAQRPELAFSVSATIRSPREGERDGVDYHFLTPEDFAARVEADGFLEHAEVHGNRYGTLRSETEQLLDAGKDILLDIDVQGAKQVDESGLEAHLVFLLPPTREELERRLRGRDTDDQETIRVRLEGAGRELEAIGIFRYVILNDEVERATSRLESILQSRRNTRTAMTNVIDRVTRSFEEKRS
jgi:guanylate kinase